MSSTTKAWVWFSLEERCTWYNFIGKKNHEFKNFKFFLLRNLKVNKLVHSGLEWSSFCPIFSFLCFVYHYCLFVLFHFATVLYYLSFFALRHLIIPLQWKKPPLANSPKARREKIWQVHLCKNSTIRRPNIVMRVLIILHSPLSTNLTK